MSLEKVETIRTETLIKKAIHEDTEMYPLIDMEHDVEYCIINHDDRDYVGYKSKYDDKHALEWVTCNNLQAMDLDIELLKHIVVEEINRSDDIYQAVELVEQVIA